jgi:hypothetical protein
MRRAILIKEEIRKMEMNLPRDSDEGEDLDDVGKV